MSKIIQSPLELKKHLEQQFGFLIQSSISYDNGFDGEAKRLAHVLRTLLYDGKNSISLLNQLDLKDILFCCTCNGEYNKDIHFSGFACLLNVFLGDPRICKYIAPLGISPANMKWVSFQQWWEKNVIVDSNKNKFSRKRLIRTISNTDGGSHIDPALDKEYFQLSRENSLGWKLNSNGKWFDISSPELASVRQIAHEIILTLTNKLPELKESVPSAAFLQALDPKRNFPGFLIGGEVIITTDGNQDIVDKYMKDKTK